MGARIARRRQGVTAGARCYRGGVMPPDEGAATSPPRVSSSSCLPRARGRSAWASIGSLAEPSSKIWCALRFPLNPALRVILR